MFERFTNSIIMGSLGTIIFYYFGKMFNLNKNELFNVSLLGFVFGFFKKFNM